MLRLNVNTPVRIALEEAQRKAEKKKKGNFNTWIKLINEDLKLIDYDLKLGSQKLEEIVQDRGKWNRLIECLPCTGPTYGVVVPS